VPNCREKNTVKMLLQIRNTRKRKNKVVRLERNKGQYFIEFLVDEGKGGGKGL
jgi:hypothetical protein